MLSHDRNWFKYKIKMKKRWTFSVGGKVVMRFRVTVREAVILNLGQFITDLGNGKHLLKGRERSAALSCNGHLLLKILGGEFSYVRLPTLFQNVCTKNKTLLWYFNLNYWKKNKIAAFCLSFCSLGSQGASSCLSQSSKAAPAFLNKTDSLVFRFTYMKCNSDFTLSLKFVFFSLTEFTMWDTQPERFSLDFYFQLFLGKKPPPSLLVNMIPCPRSSVESVDWKVEHLVGPCFQSCLKESW